MARCLVCKEKISEKPSWRALLLDRSQPLVCVRCESGLTRLEVELCQLCTRPLNTEWRSIKQPDTCSDCEKWETHPTASHLLTRNQSLYSYNETMKEWMSLYKFQGDAEIGRFFSIKLMEAFETRFQGASPVLIPLSEERLVDRGFNQVQQMTEGWIETDVCLGRRTSEQQSKKNRAERVRGVDDSPFYIAEGMNRIKEVKTFVLIDDIYTTGTTIRQAAQALVSHGATTVESLTLAR
ncbi:ComF family protein [Bacillus sp. FJAT-45037]|uniref:ComF family protein n=1 Tax=Bacillus sp. FJAT-45037 TaxID=2011007 RepID=UPI000C23ADCF|nr:ComF family protein [Bacillus sp. FJAT-45037]